jgi:hypothetical protein
VTAEGQVGGAFQLAPQGINAARGLVTENEDCGALLGLQGGEDVFSDMRVDLGAVGGEVGDQLIEFQDAVIDHHGGKILSGSGFANVHAVMLEGLIRMPDQGMFVGLLVVTQLEGGNYAGGCLPDDQVEVLVGEPAAVIFPRILANLFGFCEHFPLPRLRIDNIISVCQQKACGTKLAGFAL